MHAKATELTSGQTSRDLLIALFHAIGPYADVKLEDIHGAVIATISEKGVSEETVQHGQIFSPMLLNLASLLCELRTDGLIVRKDGMFRANFSFSHAYGKAKLQSFKKTERMLIHKVAKKAKGKLTKFPSNA